MTAMVAPLQEREEGKWTHKTLNGSTSYREQCSFSPEKGQQPPTVLTTRSDTKVQYIIICRRITCRALENKIPPRGKNIRNHRKLNHVVLKKRVKNVFICGSLNYLLSNPRLQKFLYRHLDSL